MPALFGLEAVDDAAVDDQGRGAVVTFDSYFETVTVLDAVSECVEVAVAGEAHHAADRVAEIEDGILGAEQLCTGFLGCTLDGEADGVVIADLGIGHDGAGSHFGHLQHAAGFSTDAAGEVDAGSLAHKVAGAVEVSVGQGGLRTGPHLHGQSLQGGEEPVVDVLDRYTVAGMVVPYGEHTAENGRVALGEDSVTDVGGSPVLV